MPRDQHKDDPPEWTVEEVLPEKPTAKDLEGPGRLVRLSPTGSYDPRQWWPRKGQQLAVKSKPKK